MVINYFFYKYELVNSLTPITTRTKYNMDELIFYYFKYKLSILIALRAVRVPDTA